MSSHFHVCKLRWLRSYENVSHRQQHALSWVLAFKGFEGILGARLNIEYYGDGRVQPVPPAVE